MNNKIELFKEVNGGEQDFSHIGWEGKGHHAFWTMAEGYYTAAEILYDKMAESKGNYAIWDSVFYPMSFCYRHYVELRSCFEIDENY